MAMLSKSKYTSFYQCPKRLWMEEYKPSEAEIDGNTEALLERGKEIGVLARKFFGNPELAVVKHDDGSLDLSRMIEVTHMLIEKNTPVIAEASFAYDDCYCAVDILKKTGDNEYAIYEVKSASHTPGDEKEAAKKIQTYLPDVAYQAHVITSLGYKLSGVNIVLLNAEYTLPESKEIDVNELFTIINADEYLTEPFMFDIRSKIQNAKTVMNSPNEWETALGPQCKKPHDCPFIEYCMKKRGITYPSVFNLYRAKWAKRVEYLNQGIITFEDVKGKVTSAIHKMQIECTLENKDHLNADGLCSFLDTLRYPLYFLDFETTQPAIPEFVGTHPYQQIPFQYSLHIKEQPWDKVNLRHEEFLGNPDEDPRRALAEKLCQDIPADVCVIAYNKAFECTRLKELATAFPDLAEHLLSIEANVIDLMNPFTNGYYYTPAMKDSFSIKSVLPALFPDSDELNYHKLDESVQNGAMAMNAYPAMKQMNESERAVMRKALLAYCRLDTLAMVRVLERLYTLV